MPVRHRRRRHRRRCWSRPRLALAAVCLVQLWGVYASLRRGDWPAVADCVIGAAGTGYLIWILRGTSA